MSLGAPCSRGQSSEVSRRRSLYCRVSYTQREVRPALWDGASALHPDGGGNGTKVRLVHPAANPWRSGSNLRGLPVGCQGSPLRRL